MKKEYLFLAGFIIVLAAAILVSNDFQSDQTTTEKPPAAEATEQEVLVQLTEEGREDASTMGLIGAPPLQHVSHIDRWNPELRHESCLTCHADVSTGAPSPPADHYYDEDVKGNVFRDNCIQCHAEQSAVKTTWKN
ncbi:nitrate reductase cytochrome c-type subunit [Mesobacillus harenae]|uniref:nitrate reductase cytochrome c-type subunit n=1 Tax=Mesobacillus harenae TaxID=2213203 RepID=UPI0015808B7A|nr:nitrate reductase cytochrome c-type subunit [Mesobacillus harenae]